MKSLDSVWIAGFALMALVWSLNGPQVAASFPNDDKTINHVLNRVAFGPRQGDVDRVRATGLQQYLDQQLHPERIADSAVAARLDAFPTLKMSSHEIGEQYALPALQARRERQQERKNTEDP